MEMTETMYHNFVEILKEELVPAFGCTEPIAIAYCAAMARNVLGEQPDEVVIEASGNIIKNVKSVIVPNTGGLKGIPAAAAAGIVAGDESRKLEVIKNVSKEQKAAMRTCLEETHFTVKPLESEDKLDIIITVTKGADTARVRIAKTHTNITLVERNGNVLWQAGDSDEHDTAAGATSGADCSDEEEPHEGADRSQLSIGLILEFAGTARIEDVKELLDRQISYNYAIAEEGIANDWGANVGKVLLKTGGDGVRNRAKAMAAAGSDARMSGCELPVVINSGSGNQGITVSVPVIEYARELKVSDETLYRALLISNLIAVHIKFGIGTLSAFCGAVSAGCAAGCGIAYLLGGGYKEICHTLVNSLAIVSGIICDGAKPSCAGKIASSVEAGIFGYEMYQNGQQFYGEDGIVSKGVEETIGNIYRLGAQGMCDTDKEIIKIMTHCD